jgi:carbonic anhydrase
MIATDYFREGYLRFRAGRFAEESARYQALAGGQAPRAMVIACADSRVDPATIFAAGPGELFVVRNVAAIVPPYEVDGRYHGTSAAVEFAVTGLNVEMILVMGHGLCGGVAASLAAGEDRPVGRFIAPWVALLDGCRDELIARLRHLSSSERQRALEHLSIRQSLENLKTFPFVAHAVDAGRLKLEGAWFSIMDGQLHWLDWDRGVFEPVAT